MYPFFSLPTFFCFSFGMYTKSLLLVPEDFGTCLMRVQTKVQLQQLLCFFSICSIVGPFCTKLCSFNERSLCSCYCFRFLWSLSAGTFCLKQMVPWSSKLCLVGELPTSVFCRSPVESVSACIFCTCTDPPPCRTRAGTKSICVSHFQNISVSREYSHLEACSITCSPTQPQCLFFVTRYSKSFEVHSVFFQHIWWYCSKHTSCNFAQVQTLFF